MGSHKRSFGRDLAAVLASVIAVGVIAGTASAQTITGLGVTKNAGNSANEFSDGLIEGYERSTNVSVTASAPTSFTTRYVEAVGVDEGVPFSSDRTETQNTDYTTSFNVTAPRGYNLIVSTTFRGAMTTVDDGGGNATSNVSAVTGSQTGGTVLSGSLSVTDPGVRGPTNATGDLPFALTSTQTLCGVSNGSPHAHTLSFVWSASCRSEGGAFTNGDECAVRLGLALAYSGETAGDYPGQGGRTIGNDGHFVTVNVVNLCGNGVVDSCGSEQCDEGALNGFPGSCCNADCTFKSAGTECGPSAGDCDLAETCTGSSGACPADTFKPAGTSCRTPVGTCDEEEFCTGSSSQCPTDEVQDIGTLCRGTTGDCDTPEFCSGAGSSGVDCPTDDVLPAATACPSDGNPCSLDECDGSSKLCQHPAGNAGAACTNDGNPCTTDTCDGVSTVCQHPAGNAGAVCRASLGFCDLQESCNGTSPTCPADGKRMPGVGCLPADGLSCTADQCDGVSNDCQYPLRPNGFVCRGAAAACDETETCDGVNGDCPADDKVPAGTPCVPDTNPCTLDECNGTANICQHPAGNAGSVCRGTAGECDAQETCDGASIVCPSDDKQPAGTACTPDSETCTLDECDGSADSCQHPPGNAGASCRLPAGDCDQEEFCDGSSGSCPVDDVQPTGTLCRSGASQCDQPEFCSGAGSSGIDCPADAAYPMGTACGSPGDTDCDNPDTCDGNFNCVVNNEASGAACGSPGNTDCDNPDTCNGSGTCVVNNEPTGTACGSPANTDCTNPDTCNGSGTCLANNEVAGTACGSPTDTDCTNPDTCNGSGTCQANDAVAGTACGDGSNSDCTDPDTCNGSGTCQANDVPDATPCNDGNSCTSPDQCSSGLCTPGSSTQCLDHYKCYKAKDLKVPAKFTKTTVNLSDQFGTETGVSVIKPAYVCNPVDKDGSGINNATDHLVCYKIKGSLVNQNVQITNQLGTLQLRAVKGKLLCVPASKTITP